MIQGMVCNNGVIDHKLECDYQTKSMSQTDSCNIVIKTGIVFLPQGGYQGAFFKIEDGAVTELVQGTYPSYYNYSYNNTTNTLTLNTYNNWSGIVRIFKYE